MPKFEKKIFKILDEQGIRTFLPLRTVVRQWKDRKKRIEVPLFPCYLFVNVHNSIKWHILKINGVVRFLQFNGEDATISDSDIATIRTSLLGNPEVSEQKFSCGDEVVITKGPLLGLKGVLVENKGKSRLAVKINMIEKILLVNIRSSDLEMYKSYAIQ